MPTHSPKIAPADMPGRGVPCDGEWFGLPATVDSVVEMEGGRAAVAGESETHADIDGETVEGGRVGAVVGVDVDGEAVGTVVWIVGAVLGVNVDGDAVGTVLGVDVDGAAVGAVLGVDVDGDAVGAVGAVVGVTDGAVVKHIMGLGPRITPVCPSSTGSQQGTDGVAELQK
jgi:hypothetical protein